MKAKFICVSIVISLFSITTVASGYQFIFIPRGTVTEKYNSNINLEENNEDHDFITLVSAGATLQLLEKTCSMSLKSLSRTFWDITFPSAVQVYTRTISFERNK